jgi:hypothetical protein
MNLKVQWENRNQDIAFLYLIRINTNVVSLSPPPLPYSTRVYLLQTTEGSGHSENDPTLLTATPTPMQIPLLFVRVRTAPPCPRYWQWTNIHMGFSIMMVCRVLHYYDSITLYIDYMLVYIYIRNILYNLSTPLSAFCVPGWPAY